jgi:hypothetical protein
VPGRLFLLYFPLQSLAVPFLFLVSFFFLLSAPTALTWAGGKEEKGWRGFLEGCKGSSGKHGKYILLYYYAISFTVHI